MTELQPLTGKATLDTSQFRAGIQDLLTDLRKVRDVSKQVGTVKITADLGVAARDTQRGAAAITAALNAIPTTAMQDRIDSMFGGFTVGAKRARDSASAIKEAFAEQAAAARATSDAEKAAAREALAAEQARTGAIRARIDELDRAVRITRSAFQSGFGDASQEEIQQLTADMNRFSRELEKVGQEAKENFGEYSREMQQVANANRLAQVTSAAARGEITRLGIASQVKLGVGSALQQYGGQANFAATGLVGFVRQSESARLATQFFEKSLQKNNIQLDKARETVARLSTTYNVLPSTIEQTIKVLTRNNYSFEQATEVLELYAASALVAGKDVGGAYEALADDVQRGTTIMSNAFGITANQATAWNQYAKSIGVASDKLTGAQKAEGFLVQLRRESSEELKEAGTILEGYGGSVGALSRQIQEAQNALGQAFLPVVLNGTRVLTQFVEAYNDAGPAVKGFTTILLGGAVALGILAAPITAVRGLFDIFGRGARDAGAAAKGIGAAADATTTLNNASKAGAFTSLVTFVKGAPAAWKAYTTSVLAAAAANNIFGVSVYRLIGTNFVAFLTTTAAGLAVAAGAVGVAAAALGIVSTRIINETQRTYDEIDAASQASFEKTMQRVAALRKEGTELSRTRARLLLARETLSAAEQGTVTGTTAFGERIYSRDEEAIRRAREEVERLTAAERALYSVEYQRARFAPQQVELTDDQTKALKTLRDTLTERAFELKLDGMTDLNRQLAEVGKGFDDLRKKVKEPFIINGQLDKFNPELIRALSDINAAQAAQEAQVRQKYLDDAVKAARTSALEVQRAEIEAMQEGQAKRAAQRQAEIDDITRAAEKEAEQYKNAPEQARQIIENGRKVVAAMRRRNAEEDVQLARESARRIRDAEGAAEDAAIAAMEEGLAKRDAARRRDLEKLKESIADRVAALASDPEAQRRVALSGQEEVRNKELAQRREHANDLRALQQQVVDAELSAEAGRIAAMQDGLAKREAQRRLDLQNLRKNIQQRIDALAGDPEAQRRVAGSGQQELNNKLSEQAQARVREERDAQSQVEAARKAARAAEIANIEDEAQQRRATREEEVREFTKGLQARLAAVRGYPAKEQEILRQARLEARAISQRYVEEDAEDARERARRIADAFLKAQDAQFAAEEAGRNNQQAQYELSLSRRLRAAEGNAVKTAQVEVQAVQDRAALADRAAQAQLERDEKRLETERDKALDNEKLSRAEREDIWRTYYANLATLSGDFQAGEKARLQKREDDEAAATERLRLARLREDNRPLTEGDTRIRDLERARDLADTDAEILAIERDISTTREAQIAKLQAQLAPGAAVRLNTEERAQKEEELKGHLQQQAMDLERQEETQDAIRQSVFSRLEAEARYAERVARTTEELQNSLRLLVAIRQTGLRDIDEKLAGPLKDEERNTLLTQRLNLLGEIADLEGKISAAPLDAEQRRLDIYKAQAQAELVLRGLGDDRAAQAQLTLEIAARELLIARQRVALASEGLDKEKAQKDEAEARLAFAQALQGQAQATQGAQASAARTQLSTEKQVSGELQRRFDLEAQLLDVAEARQRALAQIRGDAADAVNSAEVELRLTRERLNLNQRRGTITDSPQERADLLRERITLLGQQAEQERKVNAAREARAQLTLELSRAEAALNREMAGGRTNTEQDALRNIQEARERLARAERDYAQARIAYSRDASTGNTERLKAATDALTGSIKAQRDAINALAADYRRQISDMDGVRSASERLNAVVYGDARTTSGTVEERRRLEAIQRQVATARANLNTATRSGVRGSIDQARQELAFQEKQLEEQTERLQKTIRDFNFNTEDARLRAIQARRDAAQKTLQAALQEGTPELISRAAQDLAEQEERYKKQAELLERNGVKVERIGTETTRQLADQVDALGIQYDRDAATLQERARAAEKEAQAAVTFSQAVTVFEDTTADLVRTLELAGKNMALNLSRALLEAQGENRSETTTETTPARVSFAGQDLNKLAEKVAGGAQQGVKEGLQGQPGQAAPVGLTAAEVASSVQRLMAALTSPRALQPQNRITASITPATTPVVNNSTTYTFGDIHVTAPANLNPRQIAQDVKREFKNEIRRAGGTC